MYCKKGVLKNYVTFAGKNLRRRTFLGTLQGSPATFIKRMPSQVFICEFHIFDQNSYFWKQLWSAAYKQINYTTSLSSFDWQLDNQSPSSLPHETEKSRSKDFLKPKSTNTDYQVITFWYIPCCIDSYWQINVKCKNLFTSIKITKTKLKQKICLWVFLQIKYYPY